MSDMKVIGNQTLLQLPPSSFALVQDKLVPMTFGVGQTLRRAGDPLATIHFIERGLISLVSGERPDAIETGLLGSDGVVGASVFLGADTAASTAIARVGGSAWIMTRANFDHLVDVDRAFRTGLQRYLHDRLMAATHSTVAAARCTIEQRLAAWLLSAQDRLRAEQIHLTHESIANTLGVRRPGITVAMHTLEGKHAIRSLRGCILIRSREKLVYAAGCAYKLPPHTGEPHEGVMAA